MAEKDRRFLYMFAVQNACFRLCIILQKQIKSVKFPVLLQEVAGFQLHSVRVLVFVLAPALGLGFGFGLGFGLGLVLVFACIGLKEFRGGKRTKSQVLENTTRRHPRICPLSVRKRTHYPSPSREGLE